ncbi:MAG: M1 family metallopeptidase [Planctomycetota bacterium]|nr:M1 family metallopeptidase [Planctomycetota bacterium]
MIHPSLIVLMAFLSEAAGSIHPPILFEDHEFHDEPWIVIERLDHPDVFRQLDEILPTPTETRLASGAPGPDYWQQKVDYVIRVRLDESTRSLHGEERITYHNRSPHELRYLWLQLDQNRFRHDSLGNRSSRAPDFTRPQSIRNLRRHLAQREWEGGCSIHRVALPDGTALDHSIIDTVMRVELPQPLKPGETFVFDVDWSHPIVRNTTRRARSSYELFDDGHAIYEIAQWFPRLCPYSDEDGWQNKAFLGSSEFATEFGDYVVEITVPDTHVVTATGVLDNDDAVLTELQRERLQDSMTAEHPVFVITPDEALANEQRIPESTKTWRFAAENVRDFAWASSPTFAWDAWGVPVPRSDLTTLAMSFFPVEGEPLWSRYSTQAVAHAVEMYSHYTIPYPYPTAISVNGPVGGMEYPMICFNGPRPEEDGSYTARTKYGLIGVIIHEVGHNWFPMIINSDERQWTWMDEGINTFVQYLAQELWEDDYPSRRGEPSAIIDFMRSENQRPIMTHGESIIQPGNNAYAKPATALNVLRETVIGREQFDYAMREFSRRWAFKRPEPADFFRSLEDASGTDLDWFWRAWFYSTDHVDVAVERIYDFTVLPRDPEMAKGLQRMDRDGQAISITELRNAALPKRTDLYPELLDFYNRFDELDVTESDRRAYQQFMDELDSDDREVVERLQEEPLHFNVVRFRNHGGVVTPLPLELTWADGTTESVMLPAEVWKRNPRTFSKLFLSDQSLVKVRFDRRRRTADIDRTNNSFPGDVITDRFEIQPPTRRTNPIAEARAESAREDTKQAAFTIARAMLVAWMRDEMGGAPIESAPVLMADVDNRELLDGWGNPCSLNFGGEVPEDADPFQALFVEVISRGPDGVSGTEDDAAFWMSMGGSFHEQPFGPDPID